MAKLTLNTIGSRYGSVDALNDNFDAIEQAFENTFSRDGTGPNSLEATMDANSQRIINLPDPVGNTEPATKGWILAQPGQAAASAVAAAASAAAAAVSETNAEAAAEQVVDWVWKDEWATGVVYKVNNIVAVPSGTYEGWSFVCVVNHTAGATFATDFSAGRWDVLAKRGATGAGTGNMLAANNLSELTNISAARTNLGVASATGGGASGTWGISITGNAATSTNATDIANGATGALRIVGIAAKRLVDYPVLTFTAADTTTVDIGTNFESLTTITSSTSNPPTVVAARYTIQNYTGAIRFKASHSTSDGVFISRLSIFKNGTLIQAYTTFSTGNVARTNDVSVTPGDIIEWRHSTGDVSATSRVLNLSATASNSYLVRSLYLQNSEINRA